MFGGYPPRLFIKNCFLSGLIGATSALSYKQLKKNPEKLKQVVKHSVLAGGTGILFGSCFGFFRNPKAQNLVISGLKGGCNFFLISSCYLGSREALIISESMPFSIRDSSYQESVASGAITGLIVGTFWWSNVYRIVSTSMGFCAAAATGQFSVELYSKWKMKQAIKRHFPELEELEWLVLDENEKQRIIKNRQGWISWIFEVLQDKPYSAKLNIKTKDLKQELESLEEEESRLNEKLGIIDIPPVVGVSS